MFDPARNPDDSTVLLHQALADGQTQTRRFTAAAESGFKEADQVLFRDPAAGVANFNHGKASAIAKCHAHCHIDFAARRRVANGVADQVEDDLTNSVFVALDGQRLLRRMKCERYACLVSDGLNELDAALHAGGEVERREAGAGLAVHAQDVVHGSGEGADSGAQMRDPLRIGAVILGDEPGKELEAG